MDRVFLFLPELLSIMKSKKRKTLIVLIEYRVFLIFYDGDYLFFHYLDRARDNGSHSYT
jgi:hypothetical protein